jgi:hypothetical protein
MATCSGCCRTDDADRRSRSRRRRDTAELLELDALPRERADRFAAHTGFDPRGLPTPYRWFRIVPCRIQAWRANELPGRELMRDGRWRSDTAPGHAQPMEAR